MKTNDLTNLVLEGFAEAHEPDQAASADLDSSIASAQTKPESTRCVARPSTDLHTDLSHLQEMERHLTDTLHRARNFGTEYGPPTDWTSAWHLEWCHVEHAMSRIRGLLNQMNHHITSHASDHWRTALSEWDRIQPENYRLVAALITLRGQAQLLNETISDDWRQFSLTLESQIASISTSAQAFRHKLDVLAHPAVSEAESLATVPAHTTSVDDQPDPKQQALDQAAIEIQQEQHKSLGLKDVVKAMFLWVETPEERVRKNKLKA